MSDPDTKTFKYLDVPVPEHLVASAESVATDMGYDSADHEVLLEWNLVAVRWVAPESAAGAFPLDDEPPGHPSPLLRVDYEAWALPGSFSQHDPENVVYRKEHIFVRPSVLEGGSVKGYTLGPEYRFELWEDDIYREGRPEAVGMSEAGRQRLVYEVCDRYMGEMEELGSEGEVPEGISEALAAIYLAAKQRSEQET